MKSEIKKSLDKFWPTVCEGCWLPIAASIILHAGMLSLLLINWSQAPAKHLVPLHIKASLIEARKPTKIDDRNRTKSEQMRQAKKNEKRRKKEQAIAHQKEQKHQKELALKKKQEAEKQTRIKEAERKKIQQEREKQQAAQQQQRDALADKLAKEQAAREQEQQATEQSEKDTAEVADYINLITNAMSYHWNRPASARNNMETVLEIQLSPFGELQGFKVINGSGNEAFDRSVLQAIKAGTPITELKQLDRRLFEKYFRRFTFKFSPGDLLR